MTGRIFDIQRFSVHDGPGIRTTVFMKGCPLHCPWCHNPEGLSHEKEVMFIKEECIGCGRCGGVHNLEKLPLCPSEAMTEVGEDISVDSLVSLVLEDRDFYKDGGGVSFSGGECLMQSPFVTEVIKRLSKEGISCVIDTSGAVSWSMIEPTLEYTDAYLYDVKCITPQLHRRVVGIDNGIILENLKRIGDMGKRIFVRVPIIPGFNDNAEEIEKIAKTVSQIRGVEAVTLMPYHTLGKNKYYQLSKEPPYNTEKRISNEKIEEYKEIFRKNGVFIE